MTTTSRISTDSDGNDIYLCVDGQRIAKRLAGAWVVLVDGWQVTGSLYSPGGVAGRRQGELMITNKPKWFACAGVCNCGYTATNLFQVEQCDPDAEFAPEDDGEITATGDDWRAITAKVTWEMAERSGEPISARCSTVIHPADDQQESQFYRLLSDLRDQRKVNV
jgi:hypothetical protein